MADKSTDPRDDAEILNSNHDQFKRLANVSRHLNYLADSFGVTGNEIMEHRLEKLAFEISESHKILVSNSGLSSTLRLRQAQQSASNTMMAVLAGAGIAGKDENREKSND